MHALIFADNKYQPQRMGILRAPGAHRIATLLRNHKIQTHVVDFYLDWTLDEIKQIIDFQLDNNNLLFIGFSCSLMFDGATNFSEIRDYIKSKNPNITIIIGGYGTTQKGFDGADYYIEGYGEYAILALVKHLQDPSNEIDYNLDDTGNRVIYTKELYPVNKLTSLDIKYQPCDFIQPNETLSLETARGCIFKCKFCSFQLLGKSKVDYLRDPDEIYNEMLNNYNMFGTKNYIITEDTFNDTDEKVNMLCEIVKKLPFKPQFMGYVRADLLAAKPENFRKLVECGFTSMHFGIETFNESAGKIIGKGLSGDKLKNALTSFKKEYPNIYVNGTFIVGLPGESKSDIQTSAQWLIESQAIDFWTFNPLMISKKNKLIYSSEFTDNYLMYGYTKMNTQEVNTANLNNPQLLYGSKILPHMILWKNSFFDYFSAASLSYELNQSANPYKKIDAWSRFAISGLGHTLESLSNKTYGGGNPLDQKLIVHQTNEFVQKYKKQKLLSLTN